MIAALGLLASSIAPSPVALAQGDRPPLPKQARGKKKPAAAETPKPTPASATPAPLVLAAPPSRAEIDVLWKKRLEALGRDDAQGAAAALTALDRARLDLGIAELPYHAVAILREARAALEKGQPGRAIALCADAARLSPRLPGLHTTLALAHFAEDGLGFGKYLGDLGRIFSGIFAEPRHRDALLANVLVDLGLALLCAVLAFYALQLVRHVRFVHHDLGVVLGAGKTLTAILLAVMLLMPLVLGLGPVGIVTLWSFLVWIYQKRAERIVSLTLLGLVAALPLLCQLLAPLFVFQSQLGMDLLAFARGDPSAAIVTRTEKRIEREPNDVELALLLGRHYKTRGQDGPAEALLRKARSLREHHPVANNNLANLLVVTGRVKEAIPYYEKATATPQRAAAATAQFNLAQAWRSLAAQGDSDALRRHTVALQASERTEPETFRSLRALATPTRNRHVFDLPLADTELRARAERGIAPLDALRAQFWERIAPWLPINWAPVVPLGTAVLLGLLWFALRDRRFASPCARCGAVVDVVTNPELSMGDQCSQCHQIYLRGVKLDPRLRLEKEAEIHRHQSRRRSVRVVLSAILMGAGQILAGRPARGAVLLTLFFVLLLELVFWNGVVRYPIGPDATPSLAKAVVLGLLFLPAYLFGLAGVLRR